MGKKKGYKLAGSGHKPSVRPGELALVLIGGQWVEATVRDVRKETNDVWLWVSGRLGNNWYRPASRHRRSIKYTRWMPFDSPMWKRDIYRHQRRKEQVRQKQLEQEKAAEEAILRSSLRYRLGEEPSREPREYISANDPRVVKSIQSRGSSQGRKKVRGAPVIDDRENPLYVQIGKDHLDGDNPLAAKYLQAITAIQNHDATLMQAAKNHRDAKKKKDKKISSWADDDDDDTSDSSCGLGLFDSTTSATNTTTTSVTDSSSSTSTSTSSRDMDNLFDEMWNDEGWTVASGEDSVDDRGDDDDITGSVTHTSSYHPEPYEETCGSAGWNTDLEPPLDLHPDDWLQWYVSNHAEHFLTQLGGRRGYLDGAPTQAAANDPALLHAPNKFGRIIAPSTRVATQQYNDINASSLSPIDVSASAAGGVTPLLWAPHSMPQDTLQGGHDLAPSADIHDLPDCDNGHASAAGDGDGQKGVGDIISLDSPATVADNPAEPYFGPDARQLREQAVLPDQADTLERTVSVTRHASWQGAQPQERRITHQVETTTWVEVRLKEGYYVHILEPGGVKRVEFGPQRVQLVPGEKVVHGPAHTARTNSYTHGSRRSTGT